MRMPGFLRPRTAQQRAGQAGEDQALVYLQQQGLQLLERNFRCKGGEIDLIMQDGKVLVFVEVRMRSDQKFGGAAASIGSAKQKRLIMAAQIYLQRYGIPPPCRFDVIALDDKQMTWLKNAIEA
ncbi:YraN family protein [Herminiimonas sp. KBW02]|uniref:YraN family protein n=1 Tax=Herminiimonas sp. KBW02 TaxID=2153363 RepID=UPI000F5B2B61|nr:YraN family protein [Herminiimonas sp. KBW02]RQO37409.1 YraN family protein [Herminiimonas sp. KBW02]